MQRMGKESLLYYYSAQERPVGSVSPGEVFEIETHDRFQQGEGLEKMLGEETDHINAVTGPVEIMGAIPGQVLRVQIKGITPTSEGYLLSVPGKGVFSHQEKRKKRVPLQGGYAHFNERIKIPLHPHVGRIATSPAKGDYPTGIPGPFGGNMDISQLGCGSAIYLPVFVPGALLSLGDVHGAMGDGESNLSGVEIAALVRLECQLRDDLEITHPLLETEEEVMTIADGRNLDEAARTALLAMLDLLIKRAHLPYEEATMLISAAAHVRVCQLVNPRVGVRVAMAKAVIGEDLLSCPGG